MSLKKIFSENGLDVRRRDRANGIELIADLGSGVDAGVDIIGDTVIVVTGDEQYEIPGVEDARATINHGVLTIEVEDER
ncbi:MAG: hypothetical protein J07HX5_01313 [halophilic archaeon J07HX5]|jgi:hypothetical protein|nr:MAG: hypothetical protein J07HX5_01313 [halophilic archaeon J07HX5]